MHHWRYESRGKPILSGPYCFRLPQDRQRPEGSFGCRSPGRGGVSEDPGGHAPGAFGGFITCDPRSRSP